MSKPSVGLALISITACAPRVGDPFDESHAVVDSGPVTASNIEHHEPRSLANVPMWTVTLPPDSVHCFAVGIAVGDLDGDGHPEVIVSDTPCLGVTGPGRIGIFPGGRPLPETTPVWTELDWQNPARRFRRIDLAVGDVDGDDRADLLVSSSAGIQVFSRIADVHAPLGEPSFRVPGQGSFSTAVFADVDGDHGDDLAGVQSGIAKVWLATPRSPEAPFTTGRLVGPAGAMVAAGDVNHDGVDDLITTIEGSQLWLGCRRHEPGCDGGLRATPQWTTEHPVVGMIPDLDHDGWAEAMMTADGITGFDRVSLHLSQRRTGAPAAQPVWQTLSDSGYAGFAAPILVGDLDGDHRSNDLVLPGNGRVYAFFPRLSELATLQPGFAWPREDTWRDQIAARETMFGSSLAVAAAGDIDHDHFADLAITDGSPFFATRATRIYLFPGGRRTVRDDPPYLPGAHVCNLPSGKADITVDEPALARSIYVTQSRFAADDCAIAEGCVAAPGVRRLLRFATSVANFGGAPAIIPGVDTAPELYHFNECEGDFELDGFAKYDLIDAAGQTITASRKQSVFLIDVASNCIDGGRSTDYFPDTGISPGWGDVYLAGTPCQWLDTTDVPDGRYTLQVSVDVNHLIDQDDVRPDTVSLNIELSGDTVRVLSAP